MSRQTELMAHSDSKGEKRYRFYLQNSSEGLLPLYYAPDGWENAKFKIERNSKYFGMFRSMSVNELTFVKDARDFIQNVYENQGINAVITFTVQRLNESHTYVDYFTGKVDLSTYRIEETGVKVGIIDNSLTEKIKNRENQKVNIRQRISVEGYEIPAFANESPRIEFPEYLIKGMAVWGINEPASTSDASHYLPMLLTISEFNEAQSQTITGTDPMFTASSADRTLNIRGEVEGLVVCNETAATVTIRVYLKVNGTVVATLLSESGHWVDDLPFSGTFDEDFSIVSSDVISIEVAVTGAVAAPDIYHQVVQVELTEEIDQVDPISIIAYPYYEAMLRVLQIITDSNDCLKSDALGRTDTPVVTYASDGFLGHITKGLYIRDAYGLNDTISLSLAELFDSLSKLYCLGMGVKEVSGVNKVVIEPMKDFFDPQVVGYLGGKLRSEAISKEVAPDWIYTRIKTGYNSFEYEQSTNGTLSEFNTKSEFTTVISVLDNELDLVNKYRGDTMGMIDLRKTGNNSDSAKGDDDIFVIESVRKLLSPYWTARTDEDFVLITGGIDADMWYNLFLTPKRTLFRHGFRIRAALEHYLNSYLRWQMTDKNSTLTTQITGETDPIAESEDILANDLDEPYWYPEIYDVELDFDDDDLQAILVKPEGLIQLGTGKYGWILSLEAGSKEKKATMRLLRCNTNYVTPIQS